MNRIINLRRQTIQKRAYDRTFMNSKKMNQKSEGSYSLSDPIAAKSFIANLSPEARANLLKAIWEKDKVAQQIAKSLKQVKEFRKMDSNADGVVTQAEFDKYLSDKLEQLANLPTARDLKIVAFRQAIPFVGFGFMDNFIMIIAGETIDTTLGVALGISTMAAAALGNLISDVAGVGIGDTIEGITRKTGLLPKVSLSRVQLEMTRTRVASSIGAAIGVSIGCLLGMIPLLFYDTDHNKKGDTKRLKNEVETPITPDSAPV